MKILKQGSMVFHQILFFPEKAGPHEPGTLRTCFGKKNVFEALRLTCGVTFSSTL